MVPPERNERVVAQFHGREKWGTWTRLGIGVLIGFVFAGLRVHPKLLMPERPYLVGLWLAAGASLALLVVGFLLSFVALQWIIRCPQCGRSLGHITSPRYCPYCAVPLR